MTGHKDIGVQRFRFFKPLHPVGAIAIGDVEKFVIVEDLAQVR
jgi:hypothetical protein